jgi:hypothetical protein
MVEVVKDLAVCTDCFMVAATGSEAFHDMTEDDILKVEGSIEVLSKDGYVTTGMEQYGFAWEPCECCKRRYGGDRFQLLVLAEVHC